MTDAALIGPVSAPDVHVMTFNVRRRTTALPGSPDRWDARAPLVRRLLRAEQPTLLGVQEALADQVDAVAGALGPRYRRVGRGRSATGGDEHCAIFYDADRLDLTGWRQRALSATPDAPGSRSFGNLTRRIVVSAEFTDTATGARLLAFNTHLDHLSWRSRIASATMILDLVQRAESAEPDAAVVVTGDVNAGPESAVHRRLTADGGLRDAWDAASERLTPPWGTFSNYRAPRRGGRRIDLILVGARVDVRSAAVNAARFDGRAASDHEPMQAVLRHAARPTI
ncbi:endonuclease/exonuclease/phosphatase family protein [Agromyces cerinus]|uniref:Metal-dependent hydrolase, endonuclease/exonuclease/phosphatase family n=1 Tax=Agromyces cerinus subsp. cerinus TaxID=232089 RepID=A0A1N6DDA5_9MICO|nr:endonuclease/exonuclease/phosphatase family protein [Agromyces cerinus]SIN68809.1 Metal-dependent hydrolase, endonuclease/exonuclease/phosphatase family [Agromyces cerinus subsp. cerinus]